MQLASATLEKVKYCNEREEIMVVLAHDFVQWKRWGGGKDGWAVELNGWREGIEVFGDWSFEGERGGGGEEGVGWKSDGAVRFSLVARAASFLDASFAS